MKRTLIPTLILGALGCLLALPAAAQPAAEFYKGKTLEVYAGYAPGGGYDLYTRVLAKHIVKYLPGNPGHVVKNMPGAGSAKFASW